MLFSLGFISKSVCVVNEGGCDLTSTVTGTDNTSQIMVRGEELRRSLAGEEVGSADLGVVFGPAST